MKIEVNPKKSNAKYSQINVAIKAQIYSHFWVVLCAGLDRSGFQPIAAQISKSSRKKRFKTPPPAIAKPYITSQVKV